MLKTRSFSVLLLLSLFFVSFDAIAQDNERDELWRKARAFFAQNDRVGAIPALEQLLVIEPKNVELLVMLGDALISKTVHVETTDERRALRKRAREMFVRARENGDDSGYVAAMVGSMDPNGGGDPKYSSNPASDASTLKGEQAFTSGKIDEALEHYKRALEFDPTNYFAALFTGDMYLKKEEYSNAETWYQKAIAIDPMIETAYRYSATPLMRQRKFDQARDRYVEAWIIDPYNRFAVNGMMIWAEATGKRLGHPRIEPPKTEIGEDGKTKTVININILDDGSMSWIAYSSTAELWNKEKFKITFPNEHTYRRTLVEEVDRLRSVLTMARSLKVKTLAPQIAMIDKLDKDGLLEAFILMSYANEEIHQDHKAYLISNRAKLREYVTKYVIQN